MKSNVKAVSCGLFALGLSGCVSVLSGTTESVSFDSDPSGATCQLTRDGTVLGSVITPATLKVDKSRYDVDVACHLDGHQDATGHLESKWQPSVLANLDPNFWLFNGFGIGGLAVDSVTGADHSYPTLLIVDLTPLSTADVATDATAAPAPAALWSTRPDNP